MFIGGAPIVTLRAPPQADRPTIVEASVLPGRGFMLLQAKLATPDGALHDLLWAPDYAQAAEQLDGGSEDFAGNGSFGFGGAILAPFANRVRGRPLADTREIETSINGGVFRLPRNWGGREPGAEAYAMHGLILARNVPFQRTAAHFVRGRLEAGDFGGRWPGAAVLDFEWRLAQGDLLLQIQATSLGPQPLPIGLGWHPYFRLLSGRRSQARLRIPGSMRCEVNNYDEVLPTGRRLPVADTPYDLRAAGGTALGNLYLDDCFTELVAEGGKACVDLFDPASGVGVLLTSTTPPVRAIQVFAPVDQPFVVIEPQTNLADPFGAQWPAAADTGMVRLPPGSVSSYEVRVRPITRRGRATAGLCRPA
jgi:aldose 1-epimerase